MTRPPDPSPPVPATDADHASAMDTAAVPADGDSAFRTPSSPRERLEQWMEIAAVVLLAVATVATAWSGYQSARWSGVQAGKYAQASAARTESIRASTRAGQQTVVDVTLFMNYLDAYARDDTALTTFLEARFRQEFRVAFDAWIATDPRNKPDAPTSPFAMPEYQLAQQARADDLEAQAGVIFTEGEVANQHGDNYVLNTVFLASVLFFAALAERFKWNGPRVALLAMGGGILAYGLFKLIRYPVA